MFWRSRQSVCEINDSLLASYTLFDFVVEYFLSGQTVLGRPKVANKIDDQLFVLRRLQNARHCHPALLCLAYPIICLVKKVVFQKIRKGEFEAAVVQRLKDAVGICIIRNLNPDHTRLLTDEIQPIN